MSNATRRLSPFRTAALSMLVGAAALLLPRAAMAADDDNQIQHAVDNSQSQPKDPNVQHVEVDGHRMGPIDPGTGGGVDLSNPGLGPGYGGGGPAQRQKAPAPNNTKATSPCSSGAGAQTDPTSGNPVKFSTGEKFKPETDFVGSGLYPLTQVRTYRSNVRTSGMFGPNWQSTFSFPKLVVSVGCTKNKDLGVCIPNTVTFHDQDGETTTYSYTSTTDPFQYRYNGSDAAGVITHEVNDAYYYLVKGDTQYVFDAASKNILSLTDLAGGVMLTFNYTAGQLTSVSGPQGQVRFTWTGSVVTSILDPAGFTWKYDYTNGYLSKVTSPAGDWRTYEYNSSVGADLLTGILINDVRYATYSYYGDRRAQRVTLAGGEVDDQYAYGTNTTTVTNVYGGKTTYTYTSAGGALQLSNVSNAAGRGCPAGAANYYYDTNGFLDYTLDFANNKTDYTFDANGLLKGVTYAVGTSDRSRVAYAWQGKLPWTATWYDVNDKSYRRETYLYNGQGMVIDVVTEDLLNVPRKRHSHRDVTYYPGTAIIKTIVNSRIGATETRAETLQYDTAGNLTSRTDAAGNPTTWSGFDGLGRPAHVTDANSVTTDLAYDNAGRLKTSTLRAAAGNRTTTLWVNHDGQVTDVFYPTGRVDRFRYGPSGRLLQVGDENNAFSTLVPDYVNFKETVSSDRWAVTPPATTGAKVGSFSATRTQDAMGRTMTRSTPEGSSLAYDYDGSSRLYKVTRNTDRVTQYTFDARNRVKTVKNPDTGVITTLYNADGAVLSVQDPNLLPTQYGYNGFGDLVSITSPDAGSTNYDYNDFGDATTITRSGGLLINQFFDGLGRRTKRTSTTTGGTWTETWSYDSVANGKGRLGGYTDATGATDYAYQDAGDLLSQTNRNTVEANNPKTYVTSWTYNVDGSTHTMAYPGGLVLTYGYNLGNMTSIASNIAGWGTVLSNVQREPVSRVPYAWAMGSLNHSNTLDNEGRPTRLYGSDGTMDLNYTYDAWGTVHGITDAVYGNSGSFTYDLNDRLLTDTRNGFSVAYDKVGNRNSSGYTYFPSTNRLHTAGARTMDYDVRGNMGSDNGYVWSVDGFDRLSQVKYNGTLIGTYYADAASRRVYKNAGGVTKRFVYSPSGEMIYEDAAVTTAYVRTEMGMIGMQRATKYYALQTDATMRPEVALGSNNQISWRAKNGAFDRQIALDSVGGLMIGFPGQYYDEESGFWENVTRYYDGTQGRYTQTDRIGLAGGINPFVYVGSNPISQTDVLGTHPAVVVGVGVAVVGGGAVFAVTPGSFAERLSAAVDFEIGFATAVVIAVALPETIPAQLAAIVMGTGVDAALYSKSVSEIMKSKKPEACTPKK